MFFTNQFTHFETDSAVN